MMFFTPLMVATPSTDFVCADFGVYAQVDVRAACFGHQGFLYGIGEGGGDVRDREAEMQGDVDAV